MSEGEGIIKKMCVIGDGAVGKTSLIKRFIGGNFDDRYSVTIGAKTTAKNLEIAMDSGTTHLKLQICDILGSSSHSKIQKTAYKGADSAFLVLDCTRKETLYSFDLWLFYLYEVAGEIPVVVLANKSDLKPEFERDRLEELVEKYGFPCFFTSAKTGENVNDAFNTLGEMMVKPWKGVKTIPRIDISKFLKRKPEVEPDANLSALEVEDMIMASYCELLINPELAMVIFREQIKKAGTDFMNPTEQGLTKLADFLIIAASDHVDPTSLQKEREAYSNLIERIG